MFAMAPGQCCCSCEDCCNGAFASEWDVDVEFGSSTCASSPFCDFATGVFTAQKLSSCTWQYQYLNPENILDGPDCELYSPWFLDAFVVVLKINCINDTQYAVIVDITISAQRNLSCVGGSTSQMSTVDVIRYSATVDVVDFDCSGEVDFALTKAFHNTSYYGASCLVNGGGFFYRPSWILGPLCDSPATISITAVP